VILAVVRDDNVILFKQVHQEITELLNLVIYHIHSWNSETLFKLTKKRRLKSVLTLAKTSPADRAIHQNLLFSALSEMTFSLSVSELSNTLKQNMSGNFASTDDCNSMI
jgi:hypothetical protein